MSIIRSLSWSSCHGGAMCNIIIFFSLWSDGAWNVGRSNFCFKIFIFFSLWNAIWCIHLIWGDFRLLMVFCCAAHFLFPRRVYIQNDFPSVFDRGKPLFSIQRLLSQLLSRAHSSLPPSLCITTSVSKKVGLASSFFLSLSSFLGCFFFISYTRRWPAAQFLLAGRWRLAGIGCENVPPPF